jgi:hypothetical protein
MSERQPTQTPPLPDTLRDAEAYEAGQDERYVAYSDTPTPPAEELRDGEPSQEAPAHEPEQETPDGATVSEQRLSGRALAKEVRKRRKDEKAEARYKGAAATFGQWTGIGGRTARVQTAMARWETRRELKRQVRNGEISKENYVVMHDQVAHQVRIVKPVREVARTAKKVNQPTTTWRTGLNPPKSAGKTPEQLATDKYYDDNRHERQHRADLFPTKYIGARGEPHPNEKAWRAALQKDREDREAQARLAEMLSSRRGDGRDGRTPDTAPQFEVEVDPSYAQYFEEQRLLQLHEAIAQAIMDEAHARKDARGVGKLPPDEFKDLTAEMQEKVTRAFIGADAPPEVVENLIKARWNLVNSQKQSGPQRRPRR